MACSTAGGSVAASRVDGHVAIYGAQASLTYAARRRLDDWFIRHASPGLYFRILARTIPRVMQGSDAH